MTRKMSQVIKEKFVGNFTLVYNKLDDYIQFAYYLSPQLGNN